MHDIQCAEEELLNQLLSSIRLVMSVFQDVVAAVVRLNLSENGEKQSKQSKARTRKYQVDTSSVVSSVGDLSYEIRFWFSR